MKDKLMNSLKRRRKRKDRYERLVNESLEKRLAFNAAPVLNTSASPELDSIAEDSGVPIGQVGTPVSSLIDTGGTHNNFFDADGDSPGIAITGVNLEGGSLWYSTDDGSTWTDVGAVSDETPKFLSGTTGNRVYYQPAADFTGTVEDVMSFKAWDGSPPEWKQLGLDINGEAANHRLGQSISLSADGNTVAIGVPKHPTDLPRVGQVRILSWDGSAWNQVGSLIDGEGIYDDFGKHVSLSADGQTVAIGSPSYDGHNGRVRVFSWDGASWLQLGLAFDGEAGNGLGTAITLSANGQTVAIGDRNYDGENGYNSGRVQIFSWDGFAWNQVGVDIVGEARKESFGNSISFAGDGQTVAIGAIDANETGCVRVYFWDGTAWYKQGLDIVGDSSHDEFGEYVSLSSDGQTVAIGSPDDDYNTGDVRIFSWNGSAWNHLGSPIDGDANFDWAGHSISLSSDGQTVAIGSPGHGDNNNGRVRIFSWDGSTWNQLGSMIDGDTDGDMAGWSVSLSADGRTVAIGAWLNDSGGLDAGHARIYRLVSDPISTSTAVDTISVDVTEVLTPPTSLFLYGNWVVENVPAGTFIGEFIGDGAEANEYSFASGVGDTDNDAFSIVGNELFTKDAIDFESQNRYSVRIRTTDANGLFLEKAFTIFAADEAERPSLVVSPSITMTDDAVGSELPSSTSGIAVSDIIDAGGVLNNFSDQDGDSAGIAITDTQLDGGTLWFSTDGGVTWTDVGDVAEHSARVLVADGTTKLYFQTSTDSAPALEEVFTFKAWDLTGGWNNGDNKVNTSQVTALTSNSTSGIYDGPAFDSPHYASDIKMSPDGRLAYVLDPTLGVHIFDVSTPNEIIRLTDYLASGDVNDITFSSDSNYAFIAMGDGGVQIVDISTPSSPVLETTIVTDGEALAVEVTPDDKTLFVAMGEAGVASYDINSTQSPSLVSTFSNGKSAVNLFLESKGLYHDPGCTSPMLRGYCHYLFIANGNDGVTFVEVADDFNVLYELELDGYAYDIALSEPTLYESTLSSLTLAGTMSGTRRLLVASGDAGLHVVEIDYAPLNNCFATIISSTPRPRVVLETPVEGSLVEPVSDSFTPTISLDVLSTVNLAGRAYSVELSNYGRYAIVSGNETGVHAVDISKPDSPSIAWSWNTPGQAYGTAVSADGRFLFVADGDEGIRSQEIKFLAGMRSLATESAVTQTVFSADGKRAYSVARDYLYVNALSSDGEWRILHKSLLYWDQPDGITDVPNINTNARSICLSPSEDHLFVNLHKNGNGSRILTLSLTDSEEPVEISRKAGAVGGYSISKDGRFLLAGSSPQNKNLYVYDMTESAELEMIERIGFSNSGLNSSSLNRSIVSSDDGSIIYTASERYGLSVYDASNITDIKLLGRYDPHLLDSDDLALSNDGKYIFITGGPDGLHIVDVQDPTNPSVISKIDTPANALAVTLSADGRYAFVADGTSGTQVIDVQNLTAPKLIGQIYSSANAKNVEMSADGKTLVVSGDEGIQFISMESSTSFSTESDVVGTLMNSAPTSITATGTVIAENSAVGTVAGYLTAADADAEDSVTFTLVQGEGDDDNSAFEISGNEIRVTKILDYEAQRDYTIRVRATDSAGAFKEERIQLAVTDVVETPTGTPLILTAAEGVISIDAEITFDPTKIDLQRVDVADGLPQGAIATVNVVSPGRALFGVSLPGALGDRPYVLGYLKANLVGDETGAPEDLLVMSNVRFNEGNISSTSPVGIDLLRVGNAAPTLITITSTTVSEGANVGTAIGSFSTADADAGDLVFYELVSGQGGIDNAKFTIENGTLKTKVRLDYETATSHSIRVRATDAAGEFVEQAFTVSVEDVADGLSVVSVTPSSSGVKIEFSEALDTSELNALSTPGFSGGSDIQLLGSTTGFVKGSLVVSSDLRTVDFIATNGMAEDTYTLIVSSGVNGFKAQSGALLDGNADGVTGDNYLSFVDLTTAPQAVVGIESFARAPGEQASASLETDGVLKLNVETTETVSSIDFTLSFNPELLDIEAVNLGGEAPAGATVTYSVVAPGEIAVQFRSSTPLQAGVADFVAIDAGVVAEATYGEVGLLEVKNVNVNAGSVTSGGKSGVQVVAKLGDANGDANHSTIDSILAVNLATRPNRGLASYPLIDPSVVTDVSGSGENTMFDSALIATANRVEDVMGPTVERSVDEENPRRLLYRQDGEYGSVTLPRLQGAMAARASAFIGYSLGSNSQAQALFASYGADMESSDGDDDDRRNWLPDPGMIGNGG